MRGWGVKNGRGATVTVSNNGRDEATLVSKNGRDEESPRKEPVQFLRDSLSSKEKSDESGVARA